MKKILLSLIGLLLFLQAGAQQYQNFKVSIYTRAYEVEKMKDSHWLDSTWRVISEQVQPDKIYLETHRDLLIVPDATLRKAIRFFKEKGLEIGGGITYTIDESNSFETFCYTNPEHRKKVQEIAEYTARYFDDFILDDFFFTSCKCSLCVEAKGDMSWTEYRLKLMTEAGKSLVLGPARKVNPGSLLGTTLAKLPELQYFQIPGQPSFRIQFRRMGRQRRFPYGHVPLCRTTLANLVCQSS